MMKLALGLLSAALAGGVALADPAPEYSSSGIVEHFSAAESGGTSPLCPGPACLDKGLTRGVCFGTTEACAAAGASAAGGASEAVAPAPAFNLLITFRLGSDELSEQAISNLREFARALADPALATARFTIEGHTDARGSAELNDALSLRRADAVVNFLESLGIDRARLDAVGFGERALYRPDDPYADINRRVEAALIR